MSCDFFSLTGLAFSLCVQTTTYGGNADSPFVLDSFQGGMNVYIEQSDVDASENFIWSVQLLLDRLEKTNVNSVSLTWPVFTDGLRANAVYASERSLSPAAIATFTSVAKARGFGVVYHPILDEATIMRAGKGHWRGTIAPQNVSAWFESYGDLITEYASVGAEYGANAIIVGAELTSMERYTQSWQVLANDVRVVFPEGKLTYASNRGISKVFPWEMMDYISVDAFFAADAPGGASVDEIADSLRVEHATLSAQAAEIGMPLLFTEAGTTAQYGSHQYSWRWDHGTRLDQEGQARYYSALCDLWKDDLQGIYWWRTGLLQTESSSHDDSFDPMGKPAETAVSECFTALAG